jgi:UDP-glucose 6-dehydrogenase
VNSLVVGNGQIGQAVGKVIGVHQVLSLGLSDPVPGDYNIMHICFPYAADFIQQVRSYSVKYNPNHIIIYSTVPIGTTKQIPNAVHSPVEGKHPDLEMSLRFMDRWVGYNDEDQGQFVKRLFFQLGLNTKLVLNSDYTEALKLLSTAEYGVNLVFADYKAQVAEAIGMDYKLTKAWNNDYNKLYQNLGMGKRLQKYVLDSPNGKIGGHCVRPNAELLNEQHPNDLLKQIVEMK